MAVFALTFLGACGAWPDLVVDAPTVDNGAPTTGATFTLSVTVRNEGSSSADSTTLRYYRSSNATISTSDTEVGTSIVPPIDLSESGDQSISLEAPSTAGTYYYMACVDSVADESDTENNCSPALAVVVKAAPDLVVDAPTVDNGAPTTGATFTLSVTVRNEGSSSADSTTLRYYRSSNATISTSDTEVGTNIVPPLDLSESGDQSISLEAPSTAGTYYYMACVDSVADESDTANNCSLAVVVETAPDPSFAPYPGDTWGEVAAALGTGSGTTFQFETRTDDPYRSGDDVLADGWWLNLLDNSPPRTEVSVSLEAWWCDPEGCRWRRVAFQERIIAPGGDQRTTAQVMCISDETTGFRSVVDVDLRDTPDSDEVAFAIANVDCRPQDDGAPSSGSE